MKHLIFDIDGTLWDTTDVVANAWNRAISDANVSELSNLTITGDMLKKEFGKPMDVIADDLFLGISTEKKADILKLCCVYEHEEILKCTKDLSYPCMRETIRTLAKEHALYIVSNCQDGYIELVMEKNGIRDCIRDFECFGHTGLQKDENIRLLMNRNHIDEAYYIGDTEGDYISTQKAGAKFVFAEYGFGEVKTPDYRIQNFTDLLTLW